MIAPARIRVKQAGKQGIIEGFQAIPTRSIPDETALELVGCFGLCYYMNMRSMLQSEYTGFLKIFDEIGMPLFVINADRTIAACNDSAVRVFGWRREEVINAALGRFLSLEALLPALDRPAEASSTRPLSTTCFRRSGPSFSSRVSVLANADLSPGRLLVVVRDTPDEAQPGCTPPDKVARVDLISELGSIINSSLSIGTIFRMVVSELKKLISYDRASLLLYQQPSDSLLIFALDTQMRTTMKKGVRAPIEGTSAGWVVRNNKPWISSDLETTAFPLDRKLLLEGIRSTISIPLFHDRMLGVFNFDSTMPGRYGERDLEVLLPVAKHIAIALENALLFEEISREKKEWERTFDAITDMVWIEDGHQQVIRANRALLARTGFTEREIGSKVCGELLDRIGISLGICCLCSETKTTLRPTTLELTGKAGTLFNFWAYPLLDDEGRLYAIVHYLKDVTANRRIEQQLVRSDKLASLGTLVAGIAHEINNPLGIIAGYAEALLDRAKDPSLASAAEFRDFPEYLRTIHSEIFRCKTILKSLLEFARPSAGTFREIDINEVIKEVLLLLQHHSARLKHTLSLDLDRDLPKLRADAGSLRQVLMNLLLNAISFTPEGGTIRITTGPDSGGRIRLAVSDTGIGIPAENLGKIFDPFFTTRSVGEGAGLGLTISHRIVEEHGGTIDVESAPGRGTTFLIRLPAMEPAG